MLAYAARRVLSTIPVMLIVALFVFSLLYIAPGDPAAIIAGDQATPTTSPVSAMSLGLDRPFLVRFGDWLVADPARRPRHLDLHQPAGHHMIGQRIEPTLVADAGDPDPRAGLRYPDGGGRGLEARHLDRPRW